MSEEQIHPQEDDDDVEAHRLAEDPEKVASRSDDDDDVEAHHWKAGPEKFAEGADRPVE